MMRKPDVDLQVVHQIAAGALPGAGRPMVERAEKGVSTQVYRLRRSGQTFYLRVAEGPETSLAPEVLVHRLLRERGVRVPEVVHFDPFNEALGRAVMVTTEIPGAPIAQDDPSVDLRAVLVEAGRDLAAVNGLAVEGFGWIRRDRPAAARLQADLPTHRAFALDRLPEHLGRLRGIFLANEEVRLVLRTVDRHDGWLDVEQAHLAHGDLDATHIYQQGGRYTGLIDFGEIRGADRFYDLGHFALHDGEILPALVLPHLLQGYEDVASLPPDREQRIHLIGLLIGVRALARSVGRPRAAHQGHLAESIRRCLRVLAA